MQTRTNTDKPVVLVVEDEFFVREDAAWVLEDHGFEALQAATGDQALKVLETRPDVGAIFTDVRMPGDVDGLDLARIVAKRWPHILVVITSGHGRIGDEAIPDDGRFIPKPYAPEKVAQTIGAMIESRV